MTSQKNTILKFGILAFVVCMLCVPFALAESSLTAPVYTSSGISLPDISGYNFVPAPVSPSGRITGITYYIRKSNWNVVKGGIPPDSVGRINITNSEILVFNVTAKYTGPAGTIGMLDMYNSGTYPIPGIQRADAAVIIPAGKSGTLISVPFWFGQSNANNGTYTIAFELWGNKTLADYSYIYIKVT